MFVFVKSEDRKLSIRPAFVGSIKNDYLRRTLCSLMVPVTVLATIIFNLFAHSLVCVLYVVMVLFEIVRGGVAAMLVPILGLKPIWKSEIWERPRTKADGDRWME